MGLPVHVPLQVGLPYAFIFSTQSGSVEVCVGFMRQLAAACYSKRQEQSAKRKASLRAFLYVPQSDVTAQ